MAFINLTPHPIHLRKEDGSELIVPASGTVARVSSKPGQLIEHADGMPIYGSPAFGPVEGLPDQQPDTILLVSLMVLGRPEARGRSDIVAPGTGPNDGAVRNEKGHVVAVTRLIAAPAD